MILKGVGIGRGVAVGPVLRTLGPWEQKTGTTQYRITRHPESSLAL